MDNFEHPKIKEKITSGLWATAQNSVISFDELNVLIEDIYKTLPDRFKNIVNSADLEFQRTKYVSGEITTKKKVKILISEFWCPELIGTFLEIEDSHKASLYYKQIVYGYINDEGKLHILNSRPAKICCDGLSSQFKFCEQDGLKCPDNYVSYTERTGYTIHAENADYNMSFCPYCGEKL